MITPPALSMVTVSYRGDLALARELCRSVDAHLTADAEHVLVVPRRDLGLFADLVGPRRRLVTVEHVLPRGYWRLPVPYEIRIGSHTRRIRELWVTPAGISRGWIIQQIVKLCAPSYTRAESIVFADSDIVLIAGLTTEQITRDGRTRFYRVPDATADSPLHARWHDVAARMLGLPEVGFSGADYIGNLITWRRDVVIELQQQIAQVAQRRWDRVIARQSAFSEYILYGVHADRVLPGDARLFATAEDLVHAGWFYDLTTTDGIEQFVAGCTPAQVGVAIQSTEPFTLQERRALIARITARGT